ncbi:MAG TPA: GGDEF domain-containing protein [Steroidobacteraceae bacterium]|nr:GGDEF domain-containing protein [Steroidobacteraceae bacterium]
MSIETLQSLSMRAIHAQGATEAGGANTRRIDLDSSLNGCDDMLAHGGVARLEVTEVFRSVLREIVASAHGAGADLGHMRAALERRQRELLDPLERMALRAVLCGMAEQFEETRIIATPITPFAGHPSAGIPSLLSRLAQAETDALLDPLTHLANRRAFERQAQALQCRRGSLAGCALLFIDVDHFKRINDCHGHEVGDRVLGGVAELLRETSDVRSMVARFGGDEFVVLLTNTTEQVARDAGEELRRVVAQHSVRIRGGVELRVTVSIGIAMAGEREAIHALVSRADAAMYRSKRNGRDCMTWAMPPSP